MKNMMDINLDLFRWFINFLIKTSDSAVTRADKSAIESKIFDKVAISRGISQANY